MSRPRRTVTAIGIVMGAIAIELALAASASPAMAGTPLDAARQAAQSVPFSGTLSVQWTDRDGSHRRELTVRGTGGEIRIEGSQPVIATPDGRLVLEASGWALVAPGDPSTLGQAPPMSDKFDMTRITGPEVAGRPTALVDIRTRQGNTDERLYLDQETGLVLRREQIDGGQAVRVVEFTTIQIGPVAQEASLPIHHDDRSQRVQPSALPAPYRAPGRLADGYVLVGILRHTGVIQAVYSDGLHSLSIFEQRGTLDVGQLPQSGELVAMPVGNGMRFGWPGGQVITWQSGDATYTVVGDGPASGLLAAASSLPTARRLTLGQRVRTVCRRLLDELAGQG